MERAVLLLNASEEVLEVIPWWEAVKKIILHKVVCPHNYNDYYKIKTTSGDFELPSALILSNYVHIPYKKASITKNNILKRDGYKCQYCGCSLGPTTMTIDHVLPESRGGKRHWLNVVSSCKRCNNLKDNRTPEEAKMKLLNRPFVPDRTIMVLSILDRDQIKKWSRWIKENS